MWPWGHAAVAYLCYLVLTVRREEASQTRTTISAVLIGSQFPDLIDKPLAWSFALLPSGRSLGHSLLTATLLLGMGYWVVRKRGHQELVIAFATGYLSHLFTDLSPGTVFGLLSGDMSQLTWTTYLLWPLLPAPPYPNDSSFVEHFVAITLDPFFLTQIALFVIAVGIWGVLGAPGIDAVPLESTESETGRKQ